MKIPRSIVRPAFFAGVLCCGFLVGCVNERQYRTQSQPAEYNPKAKDSQAIIEVACNSDSGGREAADGRRFGRADGDRRRGLRD
jgi:hypothetical protein